MEVFDEKNVIFLLPEFEKNFRRNAQEFELSQNFLRPRTRQ